MAMILQQPDSLRLTRQQADSLATLSTKFARHADSVWTPVARSLERVPDVYSHGEVYEQYVHAREQTVDYLIRIVPDVQALLTPAQRSQGSYYIDLKFHGLDLKEIESRPAVNRPMEKETA